MSHGETSCDYSADSPLNGAFSANKKTLRTVFQETLSPHIALSSHTDLLLRQKLAQLSRDKNVSICMKHITSQ